MKEQKTERRKLINFSNIWSLNILKVALGKEGQDCVKITFELDENFYKKFKEIDQYSITSFNKSAKKLYDKEIELIKTPTSSDTLTIWVSKNSYCKLNKEIEQMKNDPKFAPINEHCQLKFQVLGSKTLF